jgi:hypothetical protein
VRFLLLDVFCGAGGSMLEGSDGVGPQRRASWRVPSRAGGLAGLDEPRTERGETNRACSGEWLAALGALVGGPRADCRGVGGESRTQLCASATEGSIVDRDRYNQTDRLESDDRLGDIVEGREALRMCWYIGRQSRRGPRRRRRRHGCLQVVRLRCTSNYTNRRSKTSSLHSNY